MVSIPALAALTGSQVEICYMGAILDLGPVAYPGGGDMVDKQEGGSRGVI